MALSGIRDMSTIEEPPADRYPVQTFVMEHNNAVIDDAIRREVERGGQVYYLHNRTETIDQCASALKRRIPGITVGVAHGQMGEEALGDVMQAMNDGTIQVLVCTTIIETGLDIPTPTPLSLKMRTGWVFPSCISFVAVLAVPPATPMPTSPTAPTRICRRLQKSVCPPSGTLRNSVPASRSPCVTWKSVAPVTCWAPSSPVT